MFLKIPKFFKRLTFISSFIFLKSINKNYFFRMEDNININTKKIINYNNFDNDITYVFVLYPDNYKDYFKKNLFEFIENIKKEFGNNLEIIYLNEIDNDLKNILNEQNWDLNNNDLLLIKKKNHKNFLKVDLIQFYYRKNSVLKLFLDLPKIENINKNILSKFQHLFLTHENNTEDLEIMKSSDNFSSNPLMKFAIKIKDIKENDLDYINKNSETKINDFFLKDKEEREIILSKIINDKSLFLPINLLENMNKDYIIELVIDENKINPTIKKELFNKLNEIKTDLKKNYPKIYENASFSLKKDSIKNSNSYIIIKNEMFYSIKSFWDHTNKDLNKYKKIIEKFPFIKNKKNVYNYKYRFNDWPELEGIVDLIEKIERNPEENQFFLNQDIKYNKYSDKLTIDSIDDVINDITKDRVIFHYSKNCYTCKVFGEAYENICKKYIETDLDKDFKFMRINNDYNNSGNYYFDYSPVFSIYKKNCLKPYIFRTENMNLKLLFDFFLVTSESEIIKDFNPIKIN